MANPIDTDAEFAARTDPHRAEILAHCYRMLGSYHDAEELLQETMVRAWRARARYDDERASLRTWLYRIATNACLNALDGRRRRPLPTSLGAPPDDPHQPLRPGGEVPWLEPFPDAALVAFGDPGIAVIERQSLRLALVAAMQHLAPRPRAVLILREVLGLPAAEVASILETSTAAVNSALQRARATLAEIRPLEETTVASGDAGERLLIDRYVDAFERADVAELGRMLAEDVVMEMPPFVNWFSGRADFTAFMARMYELRGSVWRTMRTSANGQPAIVAHRLDETGVYRLHTLQVFTVRDGAISRLTVFQLPSVFRAFGLADVLDG